MNVMPPSKPQYITKDTAVEGIPPTKAQKPNADAHVDAACPICQEPVGQRTPEGRVESWSKLPCGHKFGSHCIKHWLRLVADDRPCCPICRQDASHLCGHPVLPDLIKAANGVEKAASHESRVFELRFTDCAFCRQSRFIPVKEKKKRHMPWRFVKGCWRLVRHGQMRRERPNTHAVVFAYFPRLRDAAWEKWWSSQEPRDA